MFGLARKSNRKEGLIIQFKTNTPQWRKSVEHHHFYITRYIKLSEMWLQLNISLLKLIVSYLNNNVRKQHISQQIKIKTVGTTNSGTFIVARRFVRTVPSSG